MTGDLRVKHGLGGRKFRVPEFNVWCKMRQRCNAPECRDFKNYGGRGIKVCARWECDFAAFYADMGRPRPTPQHTIERVDNNLGYNKANCIWATRQQQNSNRRARTKLASCRKGHPLDGENVYLRPDGKRGCKICRKSNMRTFYTRKAASK